MAAVSGGGPDGALRRVVGRVSHPNYTEDALECGHTVDDYDNRRPLRRRCLACAEAAEAFFDALFPTRCLACGAMLKKGAGQWCDGACGRVALRALNAP